MSEMSLRGYAAHRRDRGLMGGTHGAVEKALASGRITALADGKIDPDLADIEWAASSVRGNGAGLVPHRGRAGNGRARRTLAEAHRELLEAKAALVRLQLAKATGQLLDAEEVTAAAFQAGRTARDTMLALPPRLGPTLAGMTNPEEITRLLEREIGSALDHLGKASSYRAQRRKPARKGRGH